MSNVFRIIARRSGAASHRPDTIARRQRRGSIPARGGADEFWRSHLPELAERALRRKTTRGTVWGRKAPPIHLRRRDS